jgi:glycosyltransferase involved in cell wall biosynthesis
VCNPTWHILTGEYPPFPGGVGDYTYSLAAALAAAGDEVHVWTTAKCGPLRPADGVVAHALPEGFGVRTIQALSGGLRAHSRNRRLLIQYVPTAFGLRAMNVPFLAWLVAQRREELWVMFHEVAFPWSRARRLRHKILAGTTQLMAAMLANRADRTFASVPAWNQLLKPLAPWKPGATWLPIPSNLPTSVDSDRMAATRLAMLSGVPDCARIVGHFGTYGPLEDPTLARAVREILSAEAEVLVLLLGRGGREFIARHGLVNHPRVMAPGEAAADVVAAHLAACDVVFQPFIDGISSRRTSAMASLALGRPMVANVGHNTEANVWSLAVELIEACDGTRIAAAVRSLLATPSYSEALGGRGQVLYRTTFALERTVEILRTPVGPC